MHDLVIRNGVVVDGTGLPRRKADVAIDAGKITRIGRVEVSGIHEIEAGARFRRPELSIFIPTMTPS
jgi:N-acyl-D-amino-acid deacylase